MFYAIRLMRAGAITETVRLSRVPAIDEEYQASPDAPHEEVVCVVHHPTREGDESSTIVATVGLR